MKHRTIYEICGFPVPHSKGYPFTASMWSGFGYAETEQLARKEIRRLVNLEKLLIEYQKWV